MTAPARRQHRLERRGRRVGPHLGRRLRRARPRAAARRTGARAGRSRTSSTPRASSASAASTPARSPATCASAARCGSASSPGMPRARRASGCSPRSSTRRRWPARRSPSEVATDTAYVVPAVGEQALHRRRGRPRHQGDDAAADGRARHRGARPAGRPPRSTTCARSSPTASSSPTAPATRRPPQVQAELLREVLGDGIPYFGICFGNQLLGKALGFGTYKLKYGHRGINQPVMDRTTGKVEVTAHNHGFAVDAPLDRRHRDARSARASGQPRLPQRRRRRGARVPATGRSPSRCSTTPRPRPARTTPPTCSTASST